MLSCVIGEKSINSFEYDEAKLRLWSNKGILKCPECGNKVLYCNGDFKVPYFRHESKGECEGTYLEENTEEHRIGIKILYDWLKTLNGIQSLEIEKYIKTTKQRPDIYFEIGDKKCCIEFQCSPISTQYNKRRELYEFAGINDIWILGINKYNISNFINEKNKSNLTCDEIKIKTIENEIDFSNNPLLYLDVSAKDIYKMNKSGFEGVLRENRDSYDYDLVLKTTYDCVFEKEALNEINFEYLITKSNNSKYEIIETTNNIISNSEKIINEFNRKFKENEYKFYSVLDNIRVPIFVLKENNCYKKHVYYGYLNSEYNINKFLKEKIKKLERKNKLEELPEYINKNLQYNNYYIEYCSNFFSSTERFYLYNSKNRYDKLHDIIVQLVDTEELYEYILKEIDNYIINIEPYIILLESLKNKYNNLNRLDYRNYIDFYYEKINDTNYKIDLYIGNENRIVLDFNKTEISYNDNIEKYNTLQDLESKIINVLSSNIRKVRYK